MLLKSSALLLGISATGVLARPADGRPELHILGPPPACLSIRRSHGVAGWCRTWLDVPSEQVLRGLVWLGVAGRRWPLAAT